MSNGINDFSSAWEFLKRLAAENSNGEANRWNITNEQVQSIMLGADKDGDGVVSQQEFRQEFFSSEAYDNLEQQYLDAFDMVAQADGVIGTLSADDMTEDMIANNGGVDRGSDDGTMAERAGGAGNGGGGNGGGSGSGNGAGDGNGAGTTATNMPERKTSADLLAGNPTKEDLVSGQAEALAAIAQERQDNNEAIAQYEGAVAAQQQAWDAETEAFNEVLENAELTKEATIEAREGVDAANDKREAVDTQVNEQQTAVDTAKAKVTALKGAEPPEQIEVGTDEETGEPIMGPNPEYPAWVAEVAAAEAEVTDAEATLASLKEDQTAAEEAYNKAVDNFMTVAQEENDLPAEITQAKQNLDKAKNDYNAIKTNKPAEITQHEQKMDILQANANAYRDAVMTLETNIPEGYKVENGEIVEANPQEGKVPHTLEEITAEDLPEGAQPTKSGDEIVAGPIKDADGNIIGQVTVSEDSEGNKTYTYFKMGLQEPEPLTYSSKYDMAAALFEGGVDENGKPIPAEDMWTNGQIDFTNMSAEDIAEVAQIYDTMVAEYNEGKPDEAKIPSFADKAQSMAAQRVIDLGDNPKKSDIADAKSDIANITAALVGIGNDLRSQLADLEPGTQEYNDIKNALDNTIKNAKNITGHYENVLKKEGVSTNPEDENYNETEAEKLAALKDAIDGLGAEIKQNAPANTDSFNAFLENNGIEASKTSPEMLSIYAEQFMAEVNGTEIVLDDAQVATVVKELMGDENFNGEKSNANAAWDRHDFSNYSPETMAKIMSEYDKAAGENGRSFLESADFYGIDASQKSNIANSIVRATGLEGDLGEYARGQVEAAITAELESGDSTFIQAIINAPNEALEYAQNLIEEMDLINQIANSDKFDDTVERVHAEISEKDALIIGLQKTASKDYISPEAIELAKTLTTDEAWDNMNFAEMSESDIAQLEKAYDSIHTEGAFDAAYKEKFPANDADNLMEAIDTFNPDTYKDTENAKSLAETLAQGGDWNDLLNGKSDKDIAAIAHYYEGGPEAFIKDYKSMGYNLETSEYTTIRQSLNAGRADAANAKTDALSDEKVTDAYQAIITDFAALDAVGNAKGKEYNAVIAEVLDNSDLTPEQKLEVLQKLSPVSDNNENNPYHAYASNYLNSMNHSDRIAAAHNMILNATSAEEAIAYANWFDAHYSTVDYNGTPLYIMDNVGTNNEVFKHLLELSENDPAIYTKLNERFNITTYSTQGNNMESFTGTYENIYGDVKSPYADMTFNDPLVNREQAIAAAEERLKDQYFNDDDGLFSGNNDRKTTTNIMNALNKGEIDSNTAAWLLNEYAEQSGTEIGDLLDLCSKRNPQAYAKLFA